MPPFVSTLPGHHFTCARIRWALVRMKANESVNAIRMRKWSSFPVASMWTSYALPMSSNRLSTGADAKRPLPSPAR